MSVRVVVTDPHPLYREALVETARSCHFEVAAAVEPDLVVKRLMSHRPDLAVLGCWRLDDATLEALDATKGTATKAVVIASYYDTRATLEAFAFLDSAARTVVLRWGWAEHPSSISLDNVTPDDWDGWGYRKIAAKHGWDSNDVDATLQTLASPVFTEEQSASRRSYLGVEYQKRGAICRRRVVVEYAPDTGQPAPMHIITSYGEAQ